VQQIRWWIGGISLVFALSWPSAAGAAEPQPIYGGAKVKPCGWPTAVALGGCTGTLVHPELVVFAAHCMEGGYGPSSATFGDNESSAAFEVPTTACKSNPKYGSQPGQDVAYCKLVKPVTQVPIVPILMGCETSVLTAGVDVVAVGFGEANDNLGWGPKREVTMKLNGIIDGEAFIGGNGKDTCYGDSGGPVFVRLADGSWRVFGITSYGEYCGAGGYYSMMHSAIAWLEQSSGLDLTPCFDAQGNWAPGAGCTGFPLDPGLGGSSWSQGCAGGAVSGPSATCGSPIGGGGSGGSSGGESGGGGGSGDWGGGGSGDWGGGGSPGGSPGAGGAPGALPACAVGGDCDACAECVDRCWCMTGDLAACQGACEPYGSGKEQSGGAPSTPHAADASAPVSGGCACATAPRGVDACAWATTALALGLMRRKKSQKRKASKGMP
jgi:hypothetical protein